MATKALFVFVYAEMSDYISQATVFNIIGVLLGPVAAIVTLWSRMAAQSTSMIGPVMARHFVQGAKTGFPAYAL